MNPKLDLDRYGPQYSKDDRFKASARLHQSKYRADALQVHDYRGYGNRLPTGAALAGLNFYPWPGMLAAVGARFPIRDKKLYWDMLASDNVPFNFFVPLRDIPWARKMCSTWAGEPVARVLRIHVEWAPTPRVLYLNDNTSFDAYIEYIARDGVVCGVGVEVKYTEREYSWGKLERERMRDPMSPYRQIHDSSELYRVGTVPKLATPTLKQLWRNQLLGEAMVQSGDSPLVRFTSVLLYPAGNVHFAQAAASYHELLRPRAKASFRAVTYEEFIRSARGHADTPRDSRWIDYLQHRYLVAAAPAYAPRK